MPVINHEKFYYIPNNHFGSIEIRESSTIMQELYHKLLDDPVKYFYVEVHSAGSIYVIPSILSDLQKDMLRYKDLHLIIANSHEAFHSIVEPIYQVVILGMGVEESQVTLISESADIKNHINYVSNQLGCRPINAYWSLIFQKWVSDYIPLQLSEGKLFNTLELKYYEKKFLNFNRRWRIHRPAFVAFLKLKGLLDKGYVSLGECDFRRSFSSVWNELLTRHSSGELNELLVQNREEILQLPPLYLDTEDLTINQVELSRNTDYYYSNTYFSVVSETNYYTYPGAENGRFLSEKVFKPMAEKHPFILISVPNCLPLLRDLGYRTFFPWINEDYDSEYDDDTRMLMILKEIERLSNFNQIQLEEFLNNVREICDHNQKILSDRFAPGHLLRLL